MLLIQDNLFVVCLFEWVKLERGGYDVHKQELPVRCAGVVLRGTRTPTSTGIGDTITVRTVCLPAD